MTEAAAGEWNLVVKVRAARPAPCPYYAPKRQEKLDGPDSTLTPVRRRFTCVNHEMEWPRKLMLYYSQHHGPRGVLDTNPRSQQQSPPSGG